MEPDVALKDTPLRSLHEAAGAKLGPFAGWRMPIEYEGTLAEHRAVRERVGLFDLTHLGKVEAVGPGALGLLQGVVTNDVAKVPVGEAQYNLVLNEGGGVIEDLIVYRLEDDRFFVVPNASNAPRVLRMLEEERADDRLHLMYHQDWCFLAVQGPESVHVMRELFPEAGDLSFMRCAGSEFHRRPVIVCGAMASDPLAAVLLLGMGIRELSLEASSISDVRAAVESVTVAQAHEAAQSALLGITASEVRAALEERFPGLPGGPESH